MAREDYKNCLESPAYFINNYVAVKDSTGNFVKHDPVTDKQLYTFNQTQRNMIEKLNGLRGKKIKLIKGRK